MAGASYAVSSFLGGEISAFAQGRFDKPDYKTSLNTCVNFFPAEIGALVRRPGSMYASHARAGGKGRVIRFDFEQSNPITPEFTDGFVRFRNGTTLIPTNDGQVVVAISTANPAVVQVSNAVTWATGDTLMFTNPSAPLLENRQFTATKVDTTHFSLADAITGATIDGSTLGTLNNPTGVVRVQELVTVYVGGSWSGIRAVQAETTDILLCPAAAPQALTVTTMPAPPNVSPAFAIGPVIFNDGPYLDPFTNGVQATPSAVSGVISITLAFPAYDATKAYAVGAFVTSSGSNYISLIDQNVNNTPASVPTAWAVTSAGAAINSGQGFLGTDIGRLVRLLSEPPAWAVGTTYAASTATTPIIVSYNPSGQPGATTYWSSLTSANTGHAPGADLLNWQIIPSGAAIWSWGKIASLTNIIDRALASSTSVGDMTAGGGLNSVFNGVFAQNATLSAEKHITGGGFPVTTVALTSYVGKNYSGASNQKIQSATVYPSSNLGFAFGIFTVPGIGNGTMTTNTTLNLRAKATLPASSSDGTLLGTSGLINNTTNAVTIVSSDQSTAWAYVWIEQISVGGIFSGGNTVSSFDMANSIGQLSFFNPPGTGTSGNGVNIEILGPALLYTNPVLTWRLGVYSNTTGWPTCGVYNDGRLYLGGAVGNRFDACVSNGIVGGTINFAPTDQFGAVSAANAISYTFNSKGVNPILWMKPDLQGLKAGTQAGEWLVQAPTAGSISPLNITARQVTSHGSANVEPIDTEHTLIFVQRFARKLLEYFPDVFSGKFSAPNLADKTVRTRAGIAELAYTSAVTPIIWGRDTLGALFGITYKRDSLASSQPPTFYAWHGHTLGSGRIVESICAGPSVGGNLDALTMVTNDPATNIRHVEVLTDTQDEQSALAAAWFLDDAVNPTSTSTSNAAIAGAPYGGLTINGLWHLNGKTVQVFAGGLDCGDRGLGPTSFTDFVVASGSIFVPYGDGISAGSGRGLFTAPFAAALPLTQIVVGFTYNSDGQVVHPMTAAETGARNGPAFGKKSRMHRYTAELVNSLGLSFGTKFSKLFPGKFQDATGKAIAPLTTYTDLMDDSLQDDYGFTHRLCWRVSRPWPANIPAIGGNLETQDQ